MFEQPNTLSSSQEKESSRLSKLFRETNTPSVFTEIEQDMQANGFFPTESQDVERIFQEHRFICRSESFEKVMDAVILNQSISISNENDSANMCMMASGRGLHTAMVEGFSGKEVGAKVKVTIVFKRDHLTSVQPIEKNSELWNTKRKTAEVSLRGTGDILPEDIVMVSFRFPVKYFPKTSLSEEEENNIDENKIAFIVRHYTKEKTDHRLH
ncbi:MAG: hypothetical protein COZ86_04910 [Candidatus Moranbacteria bacterium CG_4_8_14_3_um_filter_41_13]|nr:MAG: hypothetical protein COZ86_04910 [Candidatus Moranbacteria bacterium CG_4_8_14_3_um_filter_41_13]HCJ45458.1 hypothetical protein [Candidatus Moranbacteria bacterium]